jgi:intergrase/recombinase
LPVSRRQIKDFERWLKTQKYSSEYIRNCLKWVFRVYKNSRIKINFKQDYKQWEQKAIRVFCNYLESKGLFPNEIKTIRNKIKIKSSGRDDYVPDTQEIIKTINKIDDSNYRAMYLILLFSGIRGTELTYMLAHKRLRRVDKGSFYKVYLNYSRGSKSSYFAYLPLFLDVSKIKGSLIGMQSYLKKRNLLPYKYCRKWFYTKCIELGIPDSIADFYQGRISQSIGNNHYLGKQALADKHYSDKLIPYFEQIKEKTEA